MSYAGLPSDDWRDYSRLVQPKPTACDPEQLGTSIGTSFVSTADTTHFVSTAGYGCSFKASTHAPAAEIEQARLAAQPHT